MFRDGEFYCAICGGPFSGVDIYPDNWSDGSHETDDANNDENSDADVEQNGSPDGAHGASDHSNAEAETDGDELQQVEPASSSPASFSSDGESSPYDNMSPTTLNEVQGQDDYYGSEHTDSDHPLPGDDGDSDRSVSMTDWDLDRMPELIDEDFVNEFTYDPRVIREQDTAWTQTAYALGYNKGALGPKRAFIEHAHFVEFGALHFHPAPVAIRDPNYPAQESLELNCYWGPTGRGRPVGYAYPFHLPCFELLRFYLTGTRDHPPNHLHNPKFDKDALFHAFGGMGIQQDGPHSLDTDYPFARECQGREWISLRGYEFLVAQPFPSGMSDACDDVAIDLFQRLIPAGDGFPRSFISHDTTTELFTRVRADPFQVIPYDILFRISGFLNDKSLFSLCSASWVIHSALRENAQFWRHRIRRVSMPWLIEADILFVDDALMDGVDFKGLLCALDKVTAPKVGMSGGLMGIANRRRIWETCEDIAEVYDMCVNDPDCDESDEEVEETDEEVEETDEEVEETDEEVEETDDEEDE